MLSMMNKIHITLSMEDLERDNIEYSKKYPFIADNISSSFYNQHQRYIDRVSKGICILIPNQYMFYEDIVESLRHLPSKSLTLLMFSVLCDSQYEHSSLNGYGGSIDCQQTVVDIKLSSYMCDSITMLITYYTANFNVAIDESNIIFYKYLLLHSHRSTHFFIECYIDYVVNIVKNYDMLMKVASLLNMTIDDMKKNLYPTGLPFHKKQYYRNKIRSTYNIIIEDDIFTLTRY